MKIQKIVKFAKKNPKINMLKLNNITKLGTVFIANSNMKVLHIEY